VFSALGVIVMGRQVAANPKASAAVAEYMGPANTAQRQSLSNWRDGILTAYFCIIGAAFGAREIRNFLERRSQRLVSISFPGRTVRVPRDWTVLEASRSFHLPHASMCGGRARCSTCRVRITAGEENCPPAETDEQETLERIGAPPDVRLACQLRPQGDISVVPLVRTERAVYRAPPAKLNAERGGDSVTEKSGIQHGSHVYKPHAVCKAVHHLFRGPAQISAGFLGQQRCIGLRAVGFAAVQGGEHQRTLQRTVPPVIVILLNSSPLLRGKLDGHDVCCPCR